MSSGPYDYYEEGAWNFRCQECFKKMKSSMALFRWDNLWVGPECFEIRNPQDYIKPIPDNPSVPWSTGDPPPIFIDGSTTTSGYPMLLDGWLLNGRMLG